MADDEKIFSLEDDDEGYPVLLATRAPGQVAAQRNSGVVVRRGAASGNPNADAGSGRFTSKDGTQGEQVVRQTTRRQAPQGLTIEAFDRRRDLIRELARQAGELTDEGLTRYLEDHPSVRNANLVDINVLRADIRAQKMEDLVDVLDAKVSGRKSGSTKVTVPNSEQKKLIASFTDAEMERLLKRLQGKGWESEDLSRHVISRVKDEDRRARLEQLFGTSRRR